MHAAQIEGPLTGSRIDDQLDRSENPDALLGRLGGLEPQALPGRGDRLATLEPALGERRLLVEDDPVGLPRQQLVAVAERRGGQTVEDGLASRALDRSPEPAL